MKDGGRSSSLVQWEQQTPKQQGWVPVAGVQRGNAEGMHSTASPWESSGALPWVREEGAPASWCHCIATGVCCRRANHFTTLINVFSLFFKSIKKMPFSFPLYLSCEFLRRSRGAQHQSVPLSTALDLTSLLHQRSPGMCRWNSGCCLS